MKSQIASLTAQLTSKDSHGSRRCSSGGSSSHRSNDARRSPSRSRERAQVRPRSTRTARTLLPLVAEAEAVPPAPVDKFKYPDDCYNTVISALFTRDFDTSDFGTDHASWVTSCSRATKLVDLEALYVRNHMETKGIRSKAKLVETLLRHLAEDSEDE